MSRARGKRRETPNILRQLLAEKALAGGFKTEDLPATLAELAVLVQRARFTVSGEATLAEVEALAAAQQKVDRERAALFVACMADPGKALEPFDGGARKLNEARKWARAAAMEGAHGS